MTKSAKKQLLKRFLKFLKRNGIELQIRDNDSDGDYYRPLLPQEETKLINKYCK